MGHGRNHRGCGVSASFFRGPVRNLVAGKPSLRVTSYRRRLGSADGGRVRCLKGNDAEFEVFDCGGAD
jgi:hypothetical protein